MKTTKYIFDLELPDGTILFKNCKYTMLGEFTLDELVADMKKWVAGKSKFKLAPVNITEVE